MKNITVTVDDELYHLARRHAAAVGTTVTALVRNIIREFADGESSAERALRDEQALYARLDARRERQIDEGFAVSARDALYRTGEGEPRADAA
jgi:negative regulator of replication initiation